MNIILAVIFALNVVFAVLMAYCATRIKWKKKVEAWAVVTLMTMSVVLFFDAFYMLKVGYLP